MLTDTRLSHIVRLEASLKGFFKDEHGKTYVTESSGKRPPAVVYDALGDLEYDVVEPQNEMKS